VLILLQHMCRGTEICIILEIKINVSVSWFIFKISMCILQV
jgi:hypothetical protein